MQTFVVQRMLLVTAVLTSQHLKSLAVMVFMVLLHNEVPKLVLVGSVVFDLAFVLLNEL
jgi:hypothetical protein